MWAYDNIWRYISSVVQRQSLAIGGMEYGWALLQEFEMCQMEDQGLQYQTLILYENCEKYLIKLKYFLR